MNANIETKVKESFECEIEFGGNVVALSVLPPSMKAMSEIQKMAKSSNTDAVEVIANVTSKILSRNKQNITISADDVIDNMDVHDIQQFFDDYTAWFNLKKQS